MSVNWNYPTTVWIGENRIDDLSLACKELNILNPLFVTDKDLVSLPMTVEIITNLKNSFSKLDIFSDFTGNPTGKNITEGVKIYNNNSCDGVIAFGGGSALDVGKAIAFMCGQKRPIWDFEDVGDYWKRAEESKISSIIAIPTTAGTGSETGRASAIINEETGVKKIIFHPKFMPAIVILDPILTLDLPPRITAATGMDALAHNLEAFCAPGFHPMADGIALEGMRLVKNSLIEAVKNGKNINARLEMLTAASMGSTAFQKGLGAIHSLSHPVNAQFNVHHGLSNAIFMPYVLTFNRTEISEKIVSACDYLGLEKSFDKFLQWILDLRKEFNIPHTLSEIVEKEKIDLDKLSKMACDDPSTYSNPKKLTVADMKTLYQHSITGELF
ncbi:iron-containing alcohol dehydrogenase [Candidatus Pelagibacter sp. HTCC7211]|jgi:alcohol dehydrogenase class IV|uniref:iron-containing alcohol dehydrogenase n=1 Tax=Pelagibacter sp. (strain HTCC7211) TaxID=439493 RepID=UPI000498601F|nr:iron-containing alcohol dehydrogenase [Candidatus Pelagibacter sp. HTCC7211]|tara:strand:- start:1952 stop:3109 length:1158 start_codon:yes stop_codon:yes gene_type:complete